MPLRHSSHARVQIEKRNGKAAELELKGSLSDIVISSECERQISYQELRPLEALRLASHPYQYVMPNLRTVPH